MLFIRDLKKYQSSTGYEKNGMEWTGENRREEIKEERRRGEKRAQCDRVEEKEYNQTCCGSV